MKARLVDLLLLRPLLRSSLSVLSAHDTSASKKGEISAEKRERPAREGRSNGQDFLPLLSFFRVKD